jgi:hypothetical protein
MAWVTFFFFFFVWAVPRVMVACAPLLRSTAGDIFGMYLANMLFGEF